MTKEPGGPVMAPRALRRVVWAAIAAFVPGALASAQVRAGWALETSGVVSPGNPTVTIRVSAWFDRVPEAAELFSSGRFDLTAAEGRFSQARLYLLGSPGFVQGGAIHSIVVFQSHIPPQFPGNPSNPILAFSADWTTSDFAPRRVPLGTDTVAMWVFQSLSHPGFSPIPLHDVVEGSGFIRVVPAPGWLGWAPVAYLAIRRRRSSTMLV